MIFLMIILVMISLVSAQEITIELKRGWNILPMPFALDSYKISKVLEPIKSDMKYLYKFSNEIHPRHRSYYFPSAPEQFNRLKLFEPVAAYKIKMRRPATLTLTGEPIPYEDRKITLYPGWNCFTYVGDEPVRIREFFDQAMQDKVKTIRDYSQRRTRIHAFKSSRGRIIPERFMRLKEFEPGKAYQIYIYEQAEIIFPEPKPPLPEIGENIKNMEKYTQKQTFLISDKDWKQVLPLVPVTTWTGDEQCQKGYGTPDNVCVYPTLIYHEEKERIPLILLGDLGGVNSPIKPGQWQSFVSKGKYINKVAVRCSDLGNEVQLELKDEKDNLIAISESHKFNIKMGRHDFILDADVKPGKTYRLSFTNPVVCAFEARSNAIYHEGHFSEIEDWDLSVLIYGDDFRTNFDADSIIYFMQQYSTDKVITTKEILQELKDLLITPLESGAGLEQNQVNQIDINNPFYYLSYWKSYNNIVYVEDDYELGLLASTYASLINAPLIIQNTNLDKEEVFIERNIICVGKVNKNCNEYYDLDKLQKKYVEKTRTNKIILTNSNDLSIGVEERFKPDRSSSPISEIYSKTSLNAPILASAKHEIIIPVKTNIVDQVDNALEKGANNLGIQKGYLTILGTSDSIESLFEYEYDWGGNLMKAASNADLTKYSVLNEDQDKLIDLAPGRIFGITTSDVSSYIARVLFYDYLEKSNSIVTLAGDYTDALADALAYEKLFNDLDYKAHSVIEYDGCCPYAAEPEDFEDKFFVFYRDHALHNWLGISSKELPLLKNTFILGSGCSSCIYRQHKLPTLMCARALRNGAIGYWGMLEGGGSPDINEITSSIFTGRDLGNAYLSGLASVYISLGILESRYWYNDWYKSHEKFGMIGDPTFKLKPSFKFPYSEVNKLEEDTYEINLKMAVIPLKFSHRNRVRSLNFDGDNIIVSGSTQDNSMFIYHDSPVVKIATRVGPIDKNKDYSSVKILENFNCLNGNCIFLGPYEWINDKKYLWVVFESEQRELPFEIQDTGGLFKNANIKFELEGEKVGADDEEVEEEDVKEDE